MLLERGSWALYRRTGAHTIFQFELHRHESHHQLEETPQHSAEMISMTGSCMADRDSESVGDHHSIHVGGAAQELLCLDPLH